MAKRFEYMLYSPAWGILTLPLINFSSCWDQKGCDSVFGKYLGAVLLIAIISYFVGAFKDATNQLNNKTPKMEGLQVKIKSKYGVIRNAILIVTFLLLVFLIKNLFSDLP